MRILPERAFLLLTAVLTLLITACGSAEPTPFPTPLVSGALSTIEPTSAVPTPTAVSTTIPLPTATAVAPTHPSLPAPTVTLMATQPAQPGPTPLPTEPPTAATSPNSHTVVFVAADDVLNVRQSPGIDGQLVGTLAPGARSVQITGGSVNVDGSAWVPVRSGSLQGWVNSRYLTTTPAGTAFCEDTAVLELLERFETAVGTRNNQLLGQITHPERGLRVRTSWWNPEVRFTGDELATLFGNPTSHDWGVEDGSGLPISGSFTDVILPLLDRDLTGATETGCNHLIAGPTAGIVTLPTEYAGTAHVSYHRAANDALGFDWGTWVVGLDEWQGKVTISYLVHYAYEI